MPFTRASFAVVLCGSLIAELMIPGEFGCHVFKRRWDFRRFTAARTNTRPSSPCARPRMLYRCAKSFYTDQTNCRFACPIWTPQDPTPRTGIRGVWVFLAVHI